MNEDEQPRRLRTYYGTKGHRQRIEKMLNQHGDMSIHHILQKYNRTWRTGITMSELAAILSQDPIFLQTGLEQTMSITGKKYPSTVWGVIQ